MRNLDKKAIWIFFFRHLTTSVGMFVLLVLAYYFLNLKKNIEDINAPVNMGSIDMNINTAFLVITPIIILLWIVGIFVWSRLEYTKYEYELTENEFKEKFGVIRKRYVTIPYGRIQDVGIVQNIPERLLGLSTLYIQTAGLSGMPGAEGVLPGVSPEDAEELRKTLIENSRKTGKTTAV